MGANYAPVLPPELHDHIIDYLWADPRTLCSCALVCRSFLPTSQYHLFAHLVLKHDDLNGQSSTRLATALAAAPALRTLVQHVTLEGGSTAPPSLAAHVRPRITHLTLSACRTPHALLPTLTGAPLLTTLELHHCRFDTFPELRALICAFPALSDLRLCDVYWSQNPSPAELVPPAVPHTLCLQKLLVENCALPLIVNFLMDAVPPATLTSVVLRPVNRLPLPSVARFLRTLGRSLQHLGLHVYHQDAADIVAQHLDLAHHPCLRSIALGSRTFGRLAWAPALLAHAPRTLRSLDITNYCAAVPAQIAGALDWAGVDALFQRRFTRLERVRVVERGAGGGDALRAVVSGLLPWTAAHGLLGAELRR